MDSHDTADDAVSVWSNYRQNGLTWEQKEISAMLCWLTFLSFCLKGFDHRPEAIMFALFFDLLRALQRCGDSHKQE